MKTTTAQRFGSLGKSFASPSAAPAVIGAALLASGTTDEAETAWSPAAACLLPDVLPIAGTLLSYGGSRQLAAGGTVTHDGDLVLSGHQKALRISPNGVGSGVIYHGGGENRLYSESQLQPWVVEATAGFKVRNTGNTADAPITTAAITASDTITLAGDYLSYPRISTAGNLVFYARDANRLRLDTSGVTAASSGSIGFNSETNLDTGSRDAYFVRNSASSIGLKGSGGIDGALTTGAITASGQISLPNTSAAYIKQASGEIIAGWDPAGFFFGGGLGVLNSTVWIGGSSGTTRVVNSGLIVGPSAGYASERLYVSGDAKVTGAITASPDSSNTNGTVQVVNPSVNSTLFPVSSVGAALAFTHYIDGARRGGIGVNNSGNFVVASTSNNVYNEIKFQGSNITYRSNTHTFRNAADSADAPITCGAITASGAVTAVANDFYVSDSGTYYFSNTSRNRGILISSGSGGRIGFKAGGTEWLQISDAGAITASGPIQETPTQSALDPTTTNIPSGKRQGWYNSALSEFRDWVNIGGTLLKSAAYT